VKGLDNIEEGEGGARLREESAARGRCAALAAYSTMTDFAQELRGLGEAVPLKSAT